MKSFFVRFLLIFLVLGTTLFQSQLIYGPKSAAKMKELFFNKAEFKLPENISFINNLAKYTGSESIGNTGDVYTWDFTNSFQLSVITEKEEGNQKKNQDKIVLANFNLGSLSFLELGNTVSLNKSSLASIQKLYPKRLIKFKDSKVLTYKLINGSVYTTFYFNAHNILTSISISTYDLEI